MSEEHIAVILYRLAELERITREGFAKQTDTHEALKADVDALKLWRAGIEAERAQLAVEGGGLPVWVKVLAGLLTAVGGIVAAGAHP